MMEGRWTRKKSGREPEDPILRMLVDLSVVTIQEAIFHWNKRERW
jgi:hypothetical protein